MRVMADGGLVFTTTEDSTLSREHVGSEHTVHLESGLTKPASIVLQMLGLNCSQYVLGLHPYVQSHMEGVNLQLNRGPVFPGLHGIGGTPVKRNSPTLVKR